MSRQGWEDSEFPILCEACLGNNPYVRMIRQTYGRECKICDRPFTIFKWLPGTGMRYKKTEVCQTCAKIKNVCQTCILDLEFGQPIQVRDTALKTTGDIPYSDVNKQYYIDTMDAKLKNQPHLNFSRADVSARELLRKISKADTQYNNNLPHPCSFYAAGTCNRGNECPYRHELAVNSEPSSQNIKDRYHGCNDSVEAKLPNKYAQKKTPSTEAP